MQRIIFALIVLTATPLLAADSDDDVGKEQKAMQGKWKAVAAEALGMPFPKDQIPPFTIVIGADGQSTGQMPQGDFQLKITIDPKKNPKTIENLHETGAEKGKRQYGIYKLEGDKLTVCVTPAGSAEDSRPKDFTTKDTRNVLFVFDRIKEDKKP